MLSTKFMLCSGNTLLKQENRGDKELATFRVKPTNCN